MEIETQDLGNGSLVRVSGEVDMSNSPTVRDSLMGLVKDKVPAIVVDLEAVSYMDSSGIATLVEGLQETTSYGGKFRIAGLSEKVKQVFELARLTDVFDIYADAEQAKEGL
ncbi:MAG: STAS domain-containing protein [Nitrospinaceae bacterium]|jgi:anti-sigma B factor antagonist|nr:STAS domain-containing protein [Nitrospinaceae bacterium]MBT4095362.1 STAS domain-containing protein [Nitrospinaceae bacterium]MBT4432441.1 STAS domain-containing protein [Nitrospinaceae bacterium]MBT5947592.1 STAS domain-containing protein [Nitrospinaceae bacterium]MBT6396637.1 STAS domain-containing protein [Nitrospinaceae bacterium]